MTRTLYQCGDCGYQLLPIDETETQGRFLSFVDLKGRLVSAQQVGTRVCASRRDCMRRQVYKVSGVGDPMVKVLPGAVGLEL